MKLTQTQHERLYYLLGTCGIYDFDIADELGVDLDDLEELMLIEDIGFKCVICSWWCASGDWLVGDGIVDHFGGEVCTDHEDDVYQAGLELD